MPALGLIRLELECLSDVGNLRRRQELQISIENLERSQVEAQVVGKFGGSSGKRAKVWQYQSVAGRLGDVPHGKAQSV